MDNTIDFKSTLNDYKWIFHLFCKKNAKIFDNHCCELLIYVILTPLEKIKEEQIDSCLGSPSMFSAKKRFCNHVFSLIFNLSLVFNGGKEKRLVDHINKSSCFMKLEVRKIPFSCFNFKYYQKSGLSNLMKRRWLRLNEILGRHYSFMQPKSIAAAVVSPIWQIYILDIIRYFQISDI